MYITVYKKALSLTAGAMLAQASYDFCMCIA